MDSPEAHAKIDGWRAREEATGRYLAAGDRVSASGTFLGTMTLTVNE
ncbi:MAG: hypothetical protein ROR55_10900 [Devosia sp.]